MDKKLAVIEFKDRDFYFLFVKKKSDTGLTNHKWHEHSFNEIMYLAEGESEYVIENRRYVLKKGDVLLIKAGLHHFERKNIKNDSSLFCLGFFTEEIENGELATEIFNRGEHFSLSESPALSEILKSARDKLALSENNAASFMKAIAESVIFILSDLDMKREFGRVIKNATVRAVIDYINENLASISSIDDIANAVFFSASYVRALFKREMGIGIMEYVRNKKVSRARSLILTGAKPTEIYLECGFSNYPSFFRAYKAFFGFSPRAKTK
jgi:AraC-like DNA-binding protein